jgi:hypothetical protein
MAEELKSATAKQLRVGESGARKGGRGVFAAHASLHVRLTVMRARKIAA